MPCSTASTLTTQAAIPLPAIPGLSASQNQALKLWGQNVLSQIQGAAGATGVNVIPQQYALLAASSLPPISSASNCTVTLDATQPLFGAGGSYKIVISGSPATVTFVGNSAWPLAANGSWILSFFQQASAAVSGIATISTVAGTYQTTFTTTLEAAGFARLYDALNLIVDNSTAFGLSFTFTGASGKTVWLDGLMLEPYANVAMGPSPFISTSSPLTIDNNPDGPNYVKLLGSRASSNVAYNFRGVWSSATTYLVGDEVVYQTSYWLAVAGSTNSAPSTSNANWQVVGTYSGFLGTWSALTAYVPGAEVTYQGNFWVCVTANTNSAPTVTNANWQIAGPANLDYLPDGPTTGRSASRWFYGTVSGASAAWYKLGTWVAGSVPDVLRIEYSGGGGYGTGSAAQSHATISIRGGNQTVAPNLSGISWWENGGAQAIVAVKAAATGGSTSPTNASWDIYVEVNGFSGGQWEFIPTPGATFTWSGASASDPGAASSTVVVGTGGLVMNGGGSGLDAVDDGSTYGRFLQSGLSGNIATTAGLVSNAVSAFYTASAGSPTTALGFISGWGGGVSIPGISSVTLPTNLSGYYVLSLLVVSITIQAAGASQDYRLLAQVDGALANVDQMFTKRTTEDTTQTVTVIGLEQIPSNSAFTVNAYAGYQDAGSASVSPYAILSASGLFCLLLKR